MNQEFMKGQDCKATKINNLKSMLSLLMMQPLSSSELSQKLNLSVSGGKKLTDFLKDCGIVAQIGESQKKSPVARFGRPPQKLGLNAALGYMLILNFYGNTVKLCDFSGAILLKRALQVKRKTFTGIVEMTARIHAILSQYESQHEDFTRKIISIVIVPDSRALYDEEIADKNYLDLYKSCLSATYHCPVIGIESHAACIALNELYFGSLLHSQNSAVICLDDTTSTAFILGGKLYRGTHNRAGLLQNHIFIKESHKEFERINARDWLVRECVRRVKDCPDSYLYDFYQRRGTLTVEEITDGYRKNDPNARELIQRIVSLAILIVSSTVTMLDVERVAITGDFLNISKDLGLKIAEEVRGQFCGKVQAEIVTSPAAVSNGAILAGILNTADLFLQNI